MHFPGLQYKSFVRGLNRAGFRQSKNSLDPIPKRFIHDNFQRGDLRLLSKFIKKKKHDTHFEQSEEKCITSLRNDGEIYVAKEKYQNMIGSHNLETGTVSDRCRVEPATSNLLGAKRQIVSIPSESKSFSSQSLSMFNTRINKTFSKMSTSYDST